MTTQHNFKKDDSVVCTKVGFDDIDIIREFDEDGWFTTVNGYLCNPAIFRLAKPEELAINKPIRE